MRKVDLIIIVAELVTIYYLLYEVFAIAMTGDLSWYGRGFVEWLARIGL